MSQHGDKLFAQNRCLVLGQNRGLGLLAGRNQRALLAGHPGPLVATRPLVGADRYPAMISASLLPDPYVLVLTGFGLLTTLVVWLPLVLRELPLSLPIVCIALGAVLFSLPQVTLKPLPLRYPEITERFTEFVM